jgi:hypothetical protein
MSPWNGGTSESLRSARLVRKGMPLLRDYFARFPNQVPNRFRTEEQKAVRRASSCRQRRGRAADERG